MNTRKAIANRLLTLCSHRKMTINKLAHVSGISPSTIKNILYGKSRNPGAVTIKILCDGLSITLSEFFSTPEFDALEQELK